MLESVVTKKSRYYWELAASPLYDEEKPRISWRAFLPPTGGTKHQREYLLRSVRGLIAAMIDRPRQTKGDHLAHSTVMNWTFEIRSLISWMTERDVWRFSALTGQDIADFIEFRAVLEKSDSSVNEFTLYSRVRILQEMWELRGAYAGALRINPATVDVEALSKRAPSKSSWRALDEAEAMPLIGDAVTWLNAHTKYLISVTRNRWKLERSLVGVTYVLRKRRITAFYRSIESSPEIAALRRDLHLEATHPASKVLRRAYRQTDGACYVILLFLVGMRVSELARLDTGCVKYETTNDGTQVARIRGIAAKKGGKARHWIANDEILRAIEYFEESYADARMFSKKKALILASCNRIAALGRLRGRRINRGEVAGCMLAFARSSYRRKHLV